jgi:tripartite-type tricarboxylate transporter receptor subunit TctC
VIAGASGERLTDAAQVPTLNETYPGFAVAAINAMYGPAGIPAAVLQKLSADIRAVVNSSEFTEKARRLGIDAKGNTPEELDAWTRSEIARWAEVAKAANISAD